MMQNSQYSKFETAGFQWLQGGIEKKRCLSNSFWVMYVRVPGKDFHISVVKITDPTVE